MSGASLPRQAGERLLTFELGGAVYGLPIAVVLEVTELLEMACIPTLPPDVWGVVNYHGDALPVVRRASLLDLEDSSAAPEHLVVITDRPSDAATLGLPVDRVLGLVDGAPAAARDAGPVAERRPIDGRIAGVLDAPRLVARAREVIEHSLEGAR